MVLTVHLNGQSVISKTISVHWFFKCYKPCKEVRDIRTTKRKRNMDLFTALALERQRKTVFVCFKRDRENSKTNSHFSFASWTQFCILFKINWFDQNLDSFRYGLLSVATIFFFFFLTEIFIFFVTFSLMSKML